MSGKIQIKRAYEPAAAADGRRVLVDRLWPRGVTKEAAALDEWLREVAPSTELRRWFGHDPDKWEEFRKRYREELSGNPAWSTLQAWAEESDRLTLVFAAKNETHNHAVLLREWLMNGNG